MKAPLFSLALALVATPMVAEEAVHTLEVTVLEGLSPLNLERSDSTLPKTALELDPEAIQNMSLQDLLEREAPVQVRRSGGRASASTLSIRGSNASQVKVLVDGTALNGGDRSEVDLSTLDLQLFEKVEIYRSHAPARFGLGAIGGVVNLITRKEGQKALRLGAGSHGFFEAQAELQWNGANVHHWLQLHHSHEEGDFDYTDDNLTPEDPSDDVDRTRINNDFESQTLQWSVRYETKGGTYHGGLQLLNRDKGLAGTAKFQSDSARYEEQHLHLSTEGVWQDVIYTGSESRLEIGWGLKQDRYLDPDSEIGLGAQDNRYDNQSFHFNLRHHHISSVLPQDISLLLKREDQQTEDRIAGRQQEKRHRFQGELGWDAELVVLEGRLLFEPSAAVVHIADRFSGEAKTENHHSLALGAHWFFTEALSLRAGASRSVRIPAFDELFGDRGFMLGNNNLKPESSTTFDVGLVINTDRLPGDSALRAEMTYFNSDRNNLISTVFDSRGVGRAENLGDGEVEGAEFMFRVDFPHGVSAGGTYTEQDALQKNSAIAGGTPLKIPGIYERKAAPWLQWTFAGFTLRYDVALGDERFYDSANNIKAADLETHHLGARYRYHHWNLALDIDNLTDENIEDFNNWPRPGQTTTFSVRRTL